MSVFDVKERQKHSLLWARKQQAWDYGVRSWRMWISLATRVAPRQTCRNARLGVRSCGESIRRVRKRKSRIDLLVESALLFSDAVLCGSNTECNLESGEKKLGNAGWLLRDHLLFGANEGRECRLRNAGGVVL